MEIYYNNRYRKVSDNGMSKAQLLEATVFYLQTRYNEMNAEALELSEISEKRELTKTEEKKLETLIDECEKYRHIISLTELELALHKIPDGIAASYSLKKDDVPESTDVELGGFEPERYDLNDLYERADGTACGDSKLRAKDNARAVLEEIIKEKTGIDINTCEIPEEEIERFLEESDEKYWFNEDGNLIE